jgi:homocysteine S-methyltransferase
MARYRSGLPQIEGGLFLTDGGIETSLMFQDGIDLPCFAAFHLLRDRRGARGLRRYYQRYLRVAQEMRLPFILESPTWRASPDWGQRLGYSPAELDAANRRAIAMMVRLRDRFATEETPMVISGCVGPRRDGFSASDLMTAAEAREYHERQVRAFAATEADMVTGTTMTSSAEALGIVRAAVDAGIPVAISFTLERDGLLPTGESLREAIDRIEVETASAPAYYGVNCCHPSHFVHLFDPGSPPLPRLRSLRANASPRGHAELYEAPDLDAGDPEELGQDYALLRRLHRDLTVLGGCCGTDERHIAAIARACAG